MWHYLQDAGISADELDFFLRHPMPPDIIGLNYYVTSERYIDEALEHYPHHTHGGNGIHHYADVEAVRVPLEAETGIKPLLREAWARYGLPMAVTEAHLHCHREHQCRWLRHICRAVSELKSAEDIDLRAVTAWAAFGSYGWDQLLRKPHGAYEPGIFDVRSGRPRPTAIAHMLRNICSGANAHQLRHEAKGWWEQESRLIYRAPQTQERIHKAPGPGRPLLILGKTGTLGRAIARICAERGIHHALWGRQELDLVNDKNISAALARLNPWAVINASGYVRVDDAEEESGACFQVNCDGAVALAIACRDAGIQLLSFSSDLVFDGAKGSAYTECDESRPLNAYGRSKAAAEAGILHHYPASMIVRTSAFFGPWDSHNFVHAVLRSLEAGRPFTAASDVVVTPTYVPDLVHECLDLLQDDAQGIWHITNGHAISWAELARLAAERAGYDAFLVQSLPQAEMGWKARHPANSALNTERGIKLPSLHDALGRYFASVRSLVHPVPAA
jgi:dTDP-4-dehydrorhamnose reductase